MKEFQARCRQMAVDAATQRAVPTDPAQADPWARPLEEVLQLAFTSSVPHQRFFEEAREPLHVEFILAVQVITPASGSSTARRS